ncbi:unnamed protein product [Eruca vesicaria subsp. sativa]|uniref:Uncharacterized protein n=1 Tax=Eruca vesicaria subsp. sativa TaxID=29727 RepID=A0ABC8J287_ERUVS|nr:unnamed protein product [Eruca vesicaria subsp. sativa]
MRLISRLVAEEAYVDRVSEGDVACVAGKKQGSKIKLISLVDETDGSDIKVTPSTQTTKPRRQTTFGTTSRKPMLRSTIDGGIGSSAHVCICDSWREKKGCSYSIAKEEGCAY